MELLAPARRPESAYAAFKAGADAVYMGFPGFNARRMANEVTLHDFEKLVYFARENGKKIYTAMNILIKDRELGRLYKALEFIDAIGVNAVIFQDMSIPLICREHFPSLEVHASTQTFMPNSKSILRLASHGVKRIILPREVDIDSLAKIRKMTAGKTEIEVFIHGALCHSVSGLCLFSGMYTGKSGNRGMCTQVCRKDFSTDKGSKYPPFSMRDLASGDDILRLKGLVDSIKIEGRLKSPEWVHHVVSYYRHIIDHGYEDNEHKEKLKGLFFREETKGILFNDKNLITDSHSGHIGIELGKVIKSGRNSAEVVLQKSLSIRDGVFSKKLKKAFSVIKIFIGNKEVNRASEGTKITMLVKGPAEFENGDILFKHSDNSASYNFEEHFRGESKRIVDIAVETTVSEIKLTAKYKGLLLKESSVNHSGDYAKNPQKQVLEKIFSETGDFSFDTKISWNGEPEFFIPMSILKDFKRTFYKDTDTELKEIIENIGKNFVSKLAKPEVLENAKNRMVIDDVPSKEKLLKIIESNPETDIIVPLEYYSDILGISDNVIPAVPTVIWEKESEKLEKLILKSVSEGVDKFYVMSSSSLFFLNHVLAKTDAKQTIYAGPFVYALNRLSASFFTHNENVENFVIPYEFTVDNTLEGKYYSVVYSDNVPLFIDVKAEGDYFFQKEFPGKFNKRYSPLNNELILCSENPFDFHGDLKENGKQYEYKSFESVEKTEGKKADYPAVIY